MNDHRSEEVAPFAPGERAAWEAAVRGGVSVPGTSVDESAFTGFNQFVTGRPAGVVSAVDERDVRETVRFAASCARPVAVRATGHGASVPADGAVLIDTRELDGFRIDPGTRTARVQAGVPWGRVVEAASRYGLAPLNGASPSVGVVGYTTGGGLGPLGRAYGYAADHVRSARIVTADGEQRTASAEQHPDLFFAVRGGKGNFGVITEMEFDLFPVARLFGGGIFLPGESAGAVVRAWRDWQQGVPETMQSSLSLLRFPDAPAVPGELREKYAVHVRIAFTGPTEEGERLVRPLRRLADPLLDTVAEMPYSDVASIHMDPTEPARYAERSARLARLDDAGIDVVVSAAAEGPGPELPQPLVEIRHLGGALARIPDPPNAVSYRSAEYTLFTAAPVRHEQDAGVAEFQDRLLEEMRPWRVGGPFGSFLTARENTVEDVRAAYDPDTYRRLVEVKDAWDPANRFRVNHNIPPSGTACVGPNGGNKRAT